ncbi:MAG: cytochrome b/b6 domain-containing protein [Rhodobacteraceae bacterium]|nr:cytochrome b/b6 domain-containing protein [Paracoccaceae bacterium]
MAQAQAPGQGGTVVPPDPWDPLVRISHWAIAAAVIANYLLTKPGGIWHVWIGWAVLALLGIRLIWGIIGTAEARFSAFPPNPRAAVRHLFDLFGGRAREHPSHNPAAAIMVYALWACLATVTATGLVMTGAKSPVTIAEEKAAVAAGDWSVLVKPDGEGENEGDDNERGLGKAAGEVHEVAANLMVVLALLHVAGVAVESRALGRNLVRPMILGRRRRR